jgi:hypothetical protein
MKKNKKKSKGIIYFIVLGVISVSWFLLRVIPKPSRITYPCQRMAVANSVAFISWLLSTILGISIFKIALRKLKESKIPIAVVLIFFSLIIGGTSILISSNNESRAATRRSEIIPYEPTDLNQPIGIAQGIFPGRVAWAHDESAILYDPTIANGFWWDDNNTRPEKVDRMFSLALDGITGATTAYDSWDKLFRYSNVRRGKGDQPYSPGEKIAIKVNLLMGLGGGMERANTPGPCPQLLNAIIKDLIDEVGVPGDNITVYDASARIPDYIMNPFKNHENPEFNKIRFVGNPGQLKDERFIPAREDLESKIYFADTSVTDVFLVKSVTESDYLINLTNLKAHTMAGVTLIAKNLYGSIYIPTATKEFWDNTYTYGFGPNNRTDSLGIPDIHKGLHKCAVVHDFEDGNIGFMPAREMASYNYLVDIMGHPEFYDKTVLYVIDAFYGSNNQNSICKFESFGDQYTSSLLISQDPIALESVGLDFLRNEPNCKNLVHGYVDNWLHESALADNPPSGIRYNPGNTEAGLQSLGVHEHWNNWEDKEYSRNLGSGDGIELFKVDLTTGITDHHLAVLESNYPNPFHNATTITFQLKQEAEVEITIYDQLGRKIETLVKSKYTPGSYNKVWNASNYREGIYLCRMRTEYGHIKTIKLQKF